MYLPPIPLPPSPVALALPLADPPRARLMYTAGCARTRLHPSHPSILPPRRVHNTIRQNVHSAPTPMALEPSLCSKYAFAYSSCHYYLRERGRGRGREREREEEEEYQYFIVVQLGVVAGRRGAGAAASSPLWRVSGTRVYGFSVSLIDSIGERSSRRVIPRTFSHNESRYIYVIYNLVTHNRPCDAQRPRRWTAGGGGWSRGEQRGRRCADRAEDDGAVTYRSLSLSLSLSLLAVASLLCRS